jgi:hypothetical protein
MDAHRNDLLQRLERVRVDKAENAALLAGTPVDAQVQRDAIMEAGQDFKEEEAALLRELEIA